MSRGTRVRNTISGRTGTVISLTGAGNARIGVQYADDTKKNVMSFVLEVFLEVVK